MGEESTCSTLPQDVLLVFFLIPQEASPRTTRLADRIGYPVPFSTMGLKVLISR